jgi:hypothetical protein
MRDFRPQLSRVKSSAGRRAGWGCIIIGAAIIVFCEAMLFTDVAISHRGAIHTHAEIEALHVKSPPATRLALLARWTAENMTAIVWIGYVILLEGVLAAQQRGSPARRRPHHFAMLWLASIVIWCVFDWINFYSIRAWRYIGMPPGDWERYVGYFFAFGAIVPGMLMSGQVLLNIGAFNWARSRPWRLPHAATVVILLIGLAMFIWPLVHGDPITNLTLWTSLVFLLDPINLWLGRPSMLRDWQNGWYGRTIAAFAGGLTCGLLWEFWNYWALTKWTYHLPFLGAAEHVRYFEMPVIGLIGFIPFGIECWIMWQTMRIPLDGLVEPLPDERTLL